MRGLLRGIDLKQDQLREEALGDRSRQTNEVRRLDARGKGGVRLQRHRSSTRPGSRSIAEKQSDFAKFAEPVDRPWNHPYEAAEGRERR